MIEEEFKGHRIWSLLAQIDSQLTELEKELSPDQHIDDIIAKAKYARWVIENSQPALIASGELDNSANEMQNVLNNLTYPSGNHGKIASIFAAFFNRFPYPRIQKLFKSDTNEAIDTFRREVSDLRNKMSEQSEEFENNVEQASDTVVSLQSELGQIEQKLRDLQAQSSSQVQNWEAEANARLTEKLSEASEKFAAEQTEHQERFQVLMTGGSQQLGELEVMANRVREENRKQRDDAISRLGSREKEFTEKADKIIEQLNNVLSAAGREALASDFSGNSVQEDGLYATYSKLSAGFFILSAVILGMMWYSLSREESFTFFELFMRLPVSIVFLLPGFYFAAQATDHRRSATKLRSLGLRLQAFETYLVNAGVDKPEELKSKMADEFFREKTETRERRPIFGGNSKATEKALEIVQDVVGKSTE